MTSVFDAVKFYILEKESAFFSVKRDDNNVLFYDFDFKMNWKRVNNGKQLIYCK